MNKFSEVYNAAKNLVDHGEFTGIFEELRKSRLKPLLAEADGPASAEAVALDKLRNDLDTERKKLTVTTLEKGFAKVIIAAVGDKPNKSERAATLKLLKHFYHGQSSGGQVIWVYSPPKNSEKWIFDELNGASDVALETLLSKAEDEIFTEKQRQVMCDAVQQARSISLDVVAKLSGTVDQEAKDVVKRYFSDSSITSEKFPTIIETLRGGFQKIANACSANKVILSDHPALRVANSLAGKKVYAFVYHSESMHTIYIQDMWLSFADKVNPSNLSPLYRCARTIIHELSHKCVSTEDICYGPKGLKPEGSSGLTADFALHNADSWAYFAVDVLGLLTGPDKSNGNKVNTAIDKSPTRTLTAT